MQEGRRRILDDFNPAEPDHAVRKLHKRLRRVARSLSSVWDHAQAGSLANGDIRYPSITTVGVGARAVHSGLRILVAQALGLGTCMHPQQADQLAKHAKSIPINNRSLFGEGLRAMVAKAVTTVRDYDVDDLEQVALFSIPRWAQESKSLRSLLLSLRSSANSSCFLVEAPSFTTFVLSRCMVYLSSSAYDFATWICICLSQRLLERRAISSPQVCAPQYYM